ncbi:hypothetical protein STEG23_020853 [Scotinomys teguina]
MVGSRLRRHYVNTSKTGPSLCTGPPRANLTPHPKSREHTTESRGDLPAFLRTNVLGLSTKDPRTHCPVRVCIRGLTSGYPPPNHRGPRSQPAPERVHTSP